MTHFRVLERFDGFCLLEAIPETGRTHQVRVHAAELGHPLLADSVYGSRADPSTSGLDTPQKHGLLDPPLRASSIMAHPALHARSLTFTHPASGESVTFSTDYPEDFAAALTCARSRMG